MSTEVWVALIAAVSAGIGGLIGAIAAPLGKDWVARREAERLAKAERERDESSAAGERRRAIQDVAEVLATAMEHYNAEWRGIANYQAKAEAHKAANAAWSRSRTLAEERARDLIDEWKGAFDRADMTYRRGEEPLGLETLTNLYRSAAEELARLLR